ncbi:uncharacterized protein VTP21DRAFT_536 [Calcarisporiella thermophila]|uniref:uncharacterized protein n=1 Tax=Calcarisporiella thermophila TaxID=911321 RepID=UPI003742FC64
MSKSNDSTGDTLNSQTNPYHFYQFRKNPEELEKIKKRPVRRFYERQNDLLDKFKIVDAIIDAAPEQETGEPEPQQRHLSSERTIQLAVRISFAANLILFASKVSVAALSGSLSVLASTVESFLDLISSGIIVYTARYIKSRDYYYKYPVGKARMEPLGIVVFAVIVTISFLQILVSSVRRLMDPTEGSASLKLDETGAILLLVNVFVKAILWLWCRSIKGSANVRALAIDHKNDVIFNTASSWFLAVAVETNWWYIDPVGAILLCIYIIYEWMGVLMENIRRLLGTTAKPEQLNQLSYLACRFSPLILQLDTVRAYHAGERLFVEIDIILPPDTPLNRAHDIGEALQEAVEKLDMVERCFVHLDYEGTHAIEHTGSLKKST